MQIVLLSKDRKEVIKTIEVDVKKVATATIIQHEGNFYSYHRLVNFNIAEFMQAEPPVEV